MPEQVALDIPQEEIAAFCRRHHIRRLALFGSVLTGDLGPDSDIDVLKVRASSSGTAITARRRSPSLARILYVHL